MLSGLARDWGLGSAKFRVKDVLGLGFREPLYKESCDSCRILDAGLGVTKLLLGISLEKYTRFAVRWCMHMLEIF